MRHAATVLALLLTLLLAPAAAAAPPPVSAPSAILVDAARGDVLYEKAADQRRPIASTTKLMTALLVLEESDLERTVSAAPYRASPVESKIGLRPGERMSVADLLRGLLIASANDAAVTLAEVVAGSRPAFVRRMNARAAELGLADTRFANPVGLDDPGNYSTAADLAKLTLELREHPFFRETVDLPTATLRTGARPRTITNRNLLVRRVPHVDGVKTGRTQGAGYVLIGSARQRSAALISVVLGTSSEQARNQDTMALLRWGFRQYRRVTAVRRGDVLATVPIRYRPGAELELMAARDVRRTLRRTVPRPQLRVRDVPSEVEGPIRRGQKFGRVEVVIDGEVATRVSLVASSEIPAAGAGRKAQDWVTRPVMLLVLALLVAIAAAASLLSRRAATRAREGAGPRDEVVA